MLDGSQGLEIPKPLIALGAGATLAFVLSACGTPPEAIAAAAQAKLDAATSQPRVEATTVPTPRPITVQENDTLSGLMTGNGGVWERNSEPLAWFTDSTALEMSGGIEGVLPVLWVGDEIRTGTKAEVRQYVEDNELQGDRDMMVVRFERTAEGDFIQNLVHIEGGDYGSGVTFRYVLDGHPEDNVWEVEVLEGQWVPAADITQIMRAQNISFYEAKKQYQQSQSANN